MRECKHDTDFIMCLPSGGIFKILEGYLPILTNFHFVCHCILSFKILSKHQVELSSKASHTSYGLNCSQAVFFSGEKK